MSSVGATGSRIRILDPGNITIDAVTSILSAAARDALVADLRAILGDRCTTNSTQLEHHSHGESWHADAAPDVGVFPSDTGEVSAIASAAAGTAHRWCPLASGPRSRAT